MKRVLVWGLSNRLAGTEGVINAYASNTDEVSFDFLTFDNITNYPALFEGRDNRCYQIHSKVGNPIAYYNDLNQFFTRHAAEYCALWFNTNHFANIDVLDYSYRFGIARRILHSHNSFDPKEPYLKILHHLHRHRALREATDYWACSSEAARYLYGDTEYVFVPNLIDRSRCSYSDSARLKFREEYSLGDSFVFGTVGRLTNQKNQSFLLRLMPGIIREQPDAVLLIAGDGELRNRLEDETRSLGVEDNVIFVGSQSDMKACYSALDLFVLPSLYEGLPLVLLEAQFNGLPCVVSSEVSLEAKISNCFVSLGLDSQDAWTEEILSRRYSREAQFLKGNAARFDIENCPEISESIFGGL